MLKPCAFGTVFMAVGAIPTNSITAYATRSIHPLIFGSAASLTAGVVTSLFIYLAWKTNLLAGKTSFSACLFLGPLVTYLSLSIAGMATGIISAGLLEIAMLITSIVISVFSLIGCILCDVKPC